MSTVKQLSLTCLVGLAIFSCAKVSESKHNTESTRQAGSITGYVQIYDKYGNHLPADSGVLVSVGIDTTKTDTTNTKITISLNISTKTDNTGKFTFDSAIAPSGTCYFTFSKHGYNSNMYKLVHSSTTADSLATVYLANVPPATISLDAAYLSSDSKILYLNRRVMFNKVNTQPCEVVTRYFFGKNTNVCDTSYLFQWVSGAVTGIGGDTNKIDSIRRATDGLVAAGFTDTSTIYVRAYLDNFKYYQYITPNGTTVFPNLTAPSAKVMHVKLNIDTL